MDISCQGLELVDDEVRAVQELLVIRPNRPFTLFASLDGSSLVLLELMCINHSWKVHLLWRTYHNPAILWCFPTRYPCEIAPFYENWNVIFKHCPLPPAFLCIRVLPRPVIIPPEVFELKSRILLRQRILFLSGVFESTTNWFSTLWETFHLEWFLLFYGHIFLTLLICFLAKPL